MEFHEKLQELRKQKGLTQEELAASLYVSRTAISKWESGRGYPNIESLKAIAKFFSVTVDELLSSSEVLSIAEEDRKQKAARFRDLVYGLLDLSVAMLLFLPIFADRSGEVIQTVSLAAQSGIQPYTKVTCIAMVVAMTVMGILLPALKNCHASAWTRCKATLSLVLGVCAVLVFMVTLQPYAALFTFALLLCKLFLLIKRQ